MNFAGNGKNTPKQTSPERGAVSRFMSKFTSSSNNKTQNGSLLTTNNDKAGSSTSPNAAGGDLPQGSTVVAMYGYQAKNDDELTLKPGQKVQVISQDPGLSGDEGWWAGKIANKLGVFPSNFVTASKQVAAATNPKLMYQMLDEDESPTDPTTTADVDGELGAEAGKDEEEEEVVVEEEVEELEVDQIYIREIKDDQLEIGRVIGFGGFGTVYYGQFENRAVAVKEARPNSTHQDEAFLRSVKEEAATFARLNHKHIIGFEGLCLDSEFPRIVLEYAEGGALNKFLRGRTLPPNVIVNWALQIAQGMNYLHAAFGKPIIHRDLKSSNVLIKEPIDEEADDLWVKTLKIADFGLARQTENSMKMTIAGTWAFMAPESISRARFSRASDVWSYGVLLWEMLTGDQPYRDMEEARICFGVGHYVLTLPLPKTCPESFCLLLKQCWVKKTSQRPSFAAIIANLQTVADSQFVTIPIELFSEMQEGWRDEVKALINDLRSKEKDLHKQFENLNLIKQKQQQMNAHLINCMRNLRELEIGVVAKQINLAVSSRDEAKPKPPKRMGKFKRSKLNKMGGISEPSDFRHRMTVKLTDGDTDASHVMQILADTDASMDEPMDIANPVIPRLTAIENPPSDLDNTMPLETARKYQEAKALAETQIGLPDTANDDKHLGSKKSQSQTPDSPRFGTIGIYDSDDFTSARPTPQSSRESSLNRVVSHPVGRLLLKVTQVFAAVPTGGRDVSTVASSSFLQCANGAETSSNDDNVSNGSLSSIGKVHASAAGNDSPKGFKKNWKRRSPAHKRKEKSQSLSSPTPTDKSAVKRDKIEEEDEESEVVKEGVATGTLLSMSSADSVQAADKLAPAVAAYIAYGDLIGSSSENQTMVQREDADVLASLDPLKHKDRKMSQPITATTNQAFAQDEHIAASTSGRDPLQNPSQFSHGVTDTRRAATPGPPPSNGMTSSSANNTGSDVKRKRGHGRHLSDGRAPPMLAPLDNAVKILQHHKTPAEKAKEASMDPELCRLPAPEIPMRKKAADKKKNGTNQADVERPKSLAISISRPRPSPKTNQHQQQQQQQPLPAMQTGISRMKSSMIGSGASSVFTSYQSPQQQQQHRPPQQQHQQQQAATSQDAGHGYYLQQQPPMLMPLQVQQLRNSPYQQQQQQQAGSSSGGGYIQQQQPQQVQPTNPYYGMQQSQNGYGASSSIPPSSSSTSAAANANDTRDPFDIKFPPRRGMCKSESDKSPPPSAVHKKAMAMRAMSTVSENRSILDTPMGEDRDAHPTLVMNVGTMMRGAGAPSTISISELEAEFLQ